MLSSSGLDSLVPFSRSLVRFLLLFLSLFIPFLFFVLSTFSLCIFDHFSDIFHSGFWRGLQNLPPEGFILRLTDSLQSTVLSSKALSTTMVYHRAFRKWKDFAASKLHSCACPASPCHVALYLQHLIDESHSPCVVDSAFYGIKWAHTMAGIPSPTDNPVVEAVRCA